jgi:hypothetical protein
MNRKTAWTLFIIALWSANQALATTVTYNTKAAFDAAVPGATSLTGTLPNLGDVGTSQTVGNATLSASNNIFVGGLNVDGLGDPGLDWSTKIAGNDIAISGPENLDVAILTGPSDAFGFYFHEPISNSGVASDSCNAACVDSTFKIELFSGATLIDTVNFMPANDQLVFFGLLSDTLFDAVKFTETTGGIDNEFYGEMFVRAVPLPAAAWLFGSALLGLFGLSRRKRAAPPVPS